MTKHQKRKTRHVAQDRRGNSPYSGSPYRLDELSQDRREKIMPEKYNRSSSSPQDKRGARFKRHKGPSPDHIKVNSRLSSAFGPSQSPSLRQTTQSDRSSSSSSPRDIPFRMSSVELDEPMPVVTPTDLPSYIDELYDTRRVRDRHNEIATVNSNEEEQNTQSNNTESSSDESDEDIVSDSTDSSNEDDKSDGESHNNEAASIPHSQQFTSQVKEAVTGKDITEEMKRKDRVRKEKTRMEEAAKQAIKAWKISRPTTTNLSTTDQMLLDRLHQIIPPHVLKITQRTLTNDQTRKRKRPQRDQTLSPDGEATVDKESKIDKSTLTLASAYTLILSLSTRKISSLSRSDNNAQENSAVQSPTSTLINGESDSLSTYVELQTHLSRIATERGYKIQMLRDEIRGLRGQ